MSTVVGRNAALFRKERALASVACGVLFSLCGAQAARADITDITFTSEYFFGHLMGAPAEDAAIPSPFHIDELQGTLRYDAGSVAGFGPTTRASPLRFEYADETSNILNVFAFSGTTPYGVPVKAYLLSDESFVIAAAGSGTFDAAFLGSGDFTGAVDPDDYFFDPPPAADGDPADIAVPESCGGTFCAATREQLEAYNPVGFFGLGGGGGGGDATLPPNARRANEILSSFGAVTDTELNSVVSAIDGASGAAQEEAIEATLPPTVDSGAVSAARGVRAQAQRLIGDRLARLRSPSVRRLALAEQHFEVASAFAPEDGAHVIAEPVWSADVTAEPAAGPAIDVGAAEARRFWVQSFGSYVDQNERDDVDGYASQGWGVAAGIDSDRIVEGAVLGAAFSYGRARIDADNANDTQTDVDSYQIALYGDWDLGEGWRFGSSLAYTYGQNDSVRSNVGGVGGLTARGEFRSHQGALASDLSYALETDGFVIEPELSISASYYVNEDFTETGAGGAGLDVESDGLGAVELGVGVGVERSFAVGEGAIGVELDLGYRYELLGESLETTSRFLGGGQAFATESADPVQGSVTAGLGLSWQAVDGIVLSVRYDFDYRSQHNAHSGFLRATLPF